MKLTLAIVAVTALVAAVVGGVIAIAIDGSDDGSNGTQSPAAGIPDAAGGRVRSAADLYRRDAPGVVVITATEIRR